MTVDTRQNEAEVQELAASRQKIAADSDVMGGSHLPTLLLIAVLVFSAALYVFTMRPSAFGSYHDDGIYVTTAKALAAGQGYRIISLPGEPAQTKYPPFYPFLLSLIWRAYPNFPENIVPMMVLSVTAAIGFLALTYFYLTGQGYAGGWQALVVVTLAAINWRAMIPATYLGSEMLLALLSVAVLYRAEQQQQQSGLKNGIAGATLGILIGLAMLTRSSGVALLVSVAAYYAMTRQWRRAVLPVAIGAAFLAGWVGWCYMNRTAAEGVNVPYYTNYLGHLRETLEDLSAVNHTSGPVTLLGVVSRNAFMLVIASIPVVCLGIGYDSLVYLGFTFLFFAAGFWRQLSRGARLLHIYLVCYLVLHLFWLPFVSYDRFLIPLLPFQLLFLVIELEALSALVRREFAAHDMVKRISAAFIALAVVVLVGIVVYNYSLDVYRTIQLGSFSKAAGPSADDREAIDWIKGNTDASDVLLCYRDPLYFLYTGRKATRFMPMKAGITWRQNQPLFFDIVTQNRARYLIITASDFETDYEPDLQQQSFRSLVNGHPEMFTPAFQAKNGRSTVYRIANNAEPAGSARETYGKRR
jgi:hypothetical protein